MKKLKPNQIWRDSDPKGFWDVRILAVRKDSYDYQFWPRIGTNDNFSSDMHTAHINSGPHMGGNFLVNTPVV